MLKTLYLYNFLADYDRNGIIAFLEKMAGKGWILKSKNGIAYKFERTDKQYLKYDITYFADADKDNNYLPYESREYFEMAKAGGWQFLTNDRKMMIFITETPDAVPLETDPANQVEVIHQSMLLGYLIPKSLLAIFWLWTRIDTFRILADGLIISFWGIITVEIIWYIKWYLKAKKVAKESNLFYETKTPWIMLYVQPLIIAWMLMYIIDYMEIYGVIMIAFMAYYIYKDN